MLIIRPGHYIALNNLGDIYAFTLENYLKAEEYFLKSVKSSPTNVNGYAQLATIYEYRYTAKAASAELILLEGIKANPKNVYLLALLGDYYRRHNNTVEALRYFREALAVSPNNASLQAEIAALEGTAQN